MIKHLMINKTSYPRFWLYILRSYCMQVSECSLIKVNRLYRFPDCLKKRCIVKKKIALNF